MDPAPSARSFGGVSPRTGDHVEGRLDQLIAEGRIVAGTDVDLARAPLGIAVRAGAPKPDMQHSECLKTIACCARNPSPFPEALPVFS